MKLTHQVDRWLYRGKRPHGLAHFLNRGWAELAAKGVTPGRLVQLEVTGRQSGNAISFPVVVADYRGERYLVSMLGEDTNWVRNVRAAGGRVVLSHGRRETVRLVEVDTDDRAPILRRYLDRAPGGRPHFPVDRRAPIEEFEAIAAHYPVFRITPEGSAEG